MHREFYRLRRDAFDGSVDPARAVLTKGEAQALGVLEEGLASGCAVMVLVGDPGLGKTTLARVLAVRAQREGVRPVFVHHPRLSFDDLVRLICEDLKLPHDRARTPFDRLRLLQSALVAGLERGRRVLVVLDEAQETPDDTLENLRLLATLEAGAYARPLQILLVGQRELDARLRQRRWRALAQRVGARATLEPLSDPEAREFLGRRLAEAGPAVPDDVFTPGAFAAVVRAGGGGPRRLERLGRLALETGSALAERPVRASTVRRVAGRIEPGERRSGFSWGPALAGGALAGALLVFAVGVRDRNLDAHRAELAQARRAAAAVRLARLNAARPPPNAVAAPVERAAVALDPPPPTALRPPIG